MTNETTPNTGATSPQLCLKCLSNVFPEENLFGSRLGLKFWRSLLHVSIKYFTTLAHWHFDCTNKWIGQNSMLMKLFYCYWNYKVIKYIHYIPPLISESCSGLRFWLIFFKAKGAVLIISALKFFIIVFIILKLLRELI